MAVIRKNFEFFGGLYLCVSCEAEAQRTVVVFQSRDVTCGAGNFIRKVLGVYVLEIAVNRFEWAGVVVKIQVVAELDDAEARSAFISAYDNAMQRYGVGWNLIMGLYWIRPWNFPTLDSQSQRYIDKKLGIQIGMNGPKGRCNATDYLAVLDTLEARFQEDAYPVHSFPELSVASWLFKDSGISAHPNATDADAQDDEADATPEAEITAAPIEPYSVDDILTDGCFIAREKLEKILERLRSKKNLVLQGPPGTEKT